MKHNYPAAWPLAKSLGLLALLSSAGLSSASAQNFQLPANGTTSITTCSGTLYDDGGPSGSYSPSANGTITIMPATTGNKVRLEFSSFSLEPGYDVVYIYDGTSVNAPLIGTYDSSISPGTVYGSSASGALTVRLSSDYTVNYSGFAATIGCVTDIPPQAQADLALQSASLSPLSVVAGGSLTANCSIYNLSGATAPSSAVGYYLSSNAVLDAADQLLGNSTGSALQVGQSSARYASFTVPAGTAPGNYYVLFTADYQNQVNESNEGNNVAAVSITVTPPAIDLTIQQAVVNPLNTAAGNSISLSCAILNQGNAPASSSSVGFYLSTNTTLDANDQLLTSQFGTALSPPYSSDRYGTAAVPPGTAPGTYYILFVADYQNQVGETNEANNVAAVSITVSPAGVDLLITQEQLYQSTVVAGNSVQMNCAISNQGNTQASSSVAGFYLSSNQTFDAADLLLSTAQGGSLSANQSSTRYAIPAIPAGTAPGSYYVLFVADPQNAVMEINEANNVRSQSLTVLAPSIDLLLQSVYLSPTTVAPGGSTAASCYLYNQGNAAANPATVGYFLSANQALDASDVLLGTTNGSVFGGNSSSRYLGLTVPAGTAAGSYYVLFVADHLSQVGETNENNNVASAPLQVVPPGVDLLIQQPYLSTNSVTPGFSLSADCVIRNAGNTTANNSPVGYYLSANQALDASDVLLSTTSGFALGAEQSSTRYASLVIPAGTAAGSYYVLFVADHLSQVGETNENNNVASVNLNVTEPFSGTVVPLSGTATITTCSTTIYDHGGFSNYNDYANGSLTILPATAGAMVRLVFTTLSTETGLDVVRVYDGTSTNAPLLGSYSGYSNSQLPPVLQATNAAGALTVQFTTDGSITSTGFTATASCATNSGQADLLFTQISAAPTAVATGSSLSLSATMLNQGAAPASSSNVSYYLSSNSTLEASDLLLGTSPGAALSAGFSNFRQALVTLPGGVAPGGYYLLFVADPANVVAEANEGNNVSFQFLTVFESNIDLLIQQPALSAGTIGAGQTLSSNCFMQNSGTAAAASSPVGYYLSANQVLDASDLLLDVVAGGSLPAGQSAARSANLNIPATTAAGNYYVLFVADPQGVVGEANENNNFLPLPLTVRQALASRQQTAGYTVAVAPNPVASGNQLRVQLQGAGVSGTASLELFNALGQRVHVQPLQLGAGRTNQAEIATQHLVTGVYSLRLSGLPGLRVTRRVVIE
ncbi:CARDB domain-containing protein [uncultured Hymenobacter sp.]|uniref:CARDB domain-containing protein n=1 Tax=uncultured Hymenobacter sp. TaxID=170016 RepID=UPI0035CACF90